MKQRIALALSSLSTVPVVASFWRVLLLTSGLMALSGALLISGFLFYHLKGSILSEIQPKSWLGNTLQLIEGEGAKVGETLEVQSLSPSDQAIISSGEIAINAESYSVLEYQLQDLQADMEPVFFWRNTMEPGRVFSAPLRWNAKGKTLVWLAHYSNWRGTIVEFGIGFRKTLSEPVVIRKLLFKPVSAGMLLTAVWSDWTTFPGWSQHSINFIESEPEAALVPLVPTVAAWVGLALFLYGIGWVFQRWHWDWRVMGVAFLLGWVAIDAHWQANLWHQLQETYHRYGGKGWKEKHLAAEDSLLFKFITEIKANLPSTPQRIFLVTAEDLQEDDYTRLRACYHLLPHNVYDYGIFLPDKGYIHAGDYVLILGAIGELAFDADKQLLQWSGQSLAAKEIYATSMGALYKLL
jgi:hypothetical protein